MATTATEKENASASFGEVEAQQLVRELRDAYGSGTTRSYDWRVTQLKNIVTMCDESERDVVDALRKDLDKPELEATLYEVNFYLL